MKYTARYLNRKTGAEYFLTIWGGDLNEAIRRAEQWARKGFILAALTSA